MQAMFFGVAEMVVVVLSWFSATAYQGFGWRYLSSLNRHSNGGSGLKFVGAGVFQVVLPHSFFPAAGGSLVSLYGPTDWPFAPFLSLFAGLGFRTLCLACGLGVIRLFILGSLAKVTRFAFAIESVSHFWGFIELGERLGRLTRFTGFHESIIGSKLWCYQPTAV